MNETLLELFRHNTWATLQLLALCQTLDDAQLDEAVPGAYGSIRETLWHIVRSDASYYRTLTGEEPCGTFPEGPVALSELAARTRQLGPYWERLLADPDVPTREITTRDGWRVRGAVPMAQAIHHAEDHRSQIRSMLGARGLEMEDVSIWDHALATGSMHKVEQSPTEASE